MVGYNRDDLIAIDNFAGVVDKETAIAVTVIGDAEIELVAEDCLDELVEMGGAAVFVDAGIVVSVGIDECDRSAELREDLLADDRSGAIGAVYGEIEPCEIDIAEVF